MELLKDIYFSPISFGSLFTSLVFLITFLYLITIKKKSTATTHLALAVGFFSLLPLSYFLSSSLYNPNSSIFRLIGALIPLPAGIHIILFFLHYPEKNNSLFPKFVLFMGWALSIATSIILFREFRSSSLFYDFTVHFWEYNLNDSYQKLGILILFLLGFIFITGIIRIILNNNGTRLALSGILFSILIVSLVPAVANLLSREWIIDRIVFLKIFEVLSFIGTILLLVFFTESTEERISYIDRICTALIFTVMLLLRIVYQFHYIDHESQFELLYNRNFDEISRKISLPENIEYIYGYNLSDDSLNTSLNGEEDEDPFPGKTNPKRELRFSFYIQKILDSLSHENDFDKLELFNNTPKEFAAYKYYLIQKLFTNPEKIEINKEKVIKQLEILETSLKPFRYRIEKMEAISFRQTFAKFLELPIENIQSIQNILKKHLAESSSEGEVLKEEILSYIQAIRFEGKPFYRSSLDEKSQHYICFLKIDTENGIVYEAGYYYISYRAYINECSNYFIYILLASIVLIYYSSKAFLHFTLIKRLSPLLNGLNSIHSGNFDVAIKNGKEDELGILLSSFNDMAIRMSEKQFSLSTQLKTSNTRKKENSDDFYKLLKEHRKLIRKQQREHFIISRFYSELNPPLPDFSSLQLEKKVLQKYKFPRRQKQIELGGDLILTEKIKLKEKNMLLFFCVDPLGRSLQGAGAAIIISSIYKIFMEELKQKENELYPEKYLEILYIKLNSFTLKLNSLLRVSCTLGIIEEKSGYIYYVFSEYPEPTSYIKGKAEYIFPKYRNKKLGIPGLNSKKIQINTYKMKPGEVLFFGSDGKDKILTDIVGTRKIYNKDRNTFLHILERSEGKLEKVFENIVLKGELIDDFSLLRIQYQPLEDIVDNSANSILMWDEYAEAREKKDWESCLDILEMSYLSNPGNEILLKNLMYTCLYLSNYEKVVEYGEEYLQNFPGELDYIYAISYSYRKTGYLEKALELGERIRLRSPDMIKNLSNLLELYYILDDKGNAKEVLEDLTSLDPENKIALQYKVILLRDFADFDINAFT